MMRSRIGMPHENPWFLITREETAEIRWQLEILEENGSGKSREYACVIAEILTAIEWHLRWLDDDEILRCIRLSGTGGCA
jgi:hypothetical protein